MNTHLERPTDSIPPTGPTMPAGLTVSDDGELLNWLGDNYVRQGRTGLDREQLQRQEAIFAAGAVLRSDSGSVFTKGSKLVDTAPVIAIARFIISGHCDYVLADDQTLDRAPDREER